MSGVKGRSGRRNETPFRDALRLALARRSKDDGQMLAELANNLIDKAVDGDFAALKEIADRLDGKPAQQLIHEGGENPVKTQIIAMWGGIEPTTDQSSD